MSGAKEISMTHTQNSASKVVFAIAVAVAVASAVAYYFVQQRKTKGRERQRPKRSLRKKSSAARRRNATFGTQSTGKSTRTNTPSVTSSPTTADKVSELESSDYDRKSEEKKDIESTAMKSANLSKTSEQAKRPTSAGAFSPPSSITTAKATPESISIDSVRTEGKSLGKEKRNAWSKTASNSSDSLSPKELSKVEKPKTLLEKSRIQTGIKLKATEKAKDSTVSLVGTTKESPSDLSSKGTQILKTGETSNVSTAIEIPTPIKHKIIDKLQLLPSHDKSPEVPKTPIKTLNSDFTTVKEDNTETARDITSAGKDVVDKKITELSASKSSSEDAPSPSEPIVLDTYCYCGERTRSSDSGNEEFSEKTVTHLTPTIVKPIRFDAFSPDNLIADMESGDLSEQTLKAPFHPHNHRTIIPFLPILHGITYASKHVQLIDYLMENYEFFEPNFIS